MTHAPTPTQDDELRALATELLGDDARPPRYDDAREAYEAAADFVDLDFEERAADQYAKEVSS